MILNRGKMRGFSIVEIVIVLAILSVLTSIVISVYKPTLESGKPRAAATVYGNALREAEDKAQRMVNDTAWGVSVQFPYIVIFSGTSYATRTTSRDKNISVASTTVSGPTEIVFTKFSGTPSATGTTTFSNLYSSSSVRISATGLINF